MNPENPLKFEYDDDDGEQSINSRQTEQNQKPTKVVGKAGPLVVTNAPKGKQELVAVGSVGIGGCGGGVGMEGENENGSKPKIENVRGKKRKIEIQKEESEEDPDKPFFAEYVYCLLPSSPLSSGLSRLFSLFPGGELLPLLFGSGRQKLRVSVKLDDFFSRPFFFGF